MMPDRALISFFRMWVSSFPNTVYWREYPFSIVFWHPCRLYRFISRLCYLLHWFAFSDFMPVPYCFNYYAATAAKSLQLCLTLCDPIDGSPPGSPVPGILQARTLEWVAISFSRRALLQFRAEKPASTRLVTSGH